MQYIPVNKPEFSLAIFDLDGTLIDSKLDIANSVRATLKNFSLKDIIPEVIYGFVGTGVEPLIKKVLQEAGANLKLNEALTYFRNHYETHLLDNTRPYPGVIDGLKRMSGIKKVVLSNKSFRFVKKIIHGLNMEQYFIDSLGGDSLSKKKPDPIAVNYIIKKMKADRKTTIIVGDSGVDIETGKAAFIKTCGVTYGYREKNELKSCGADYVVDSFEEAVYIIAQSSKLKAQS